MLNKQIPIKRDDSTGQYLVVHSMFYTIQGEGPFAGHPAVFVRLGGCNLQCPQCDTEYTEGSRPMDINDLGPKVFELWESNQQYGRWSPPLVVITGGEPFRQKLGGFVRGLLNNCARVQIETNGTLYDSSISVDDYLKITIVCSPKAGKINRQLLEYIDAYKYVLSVDNCDLVDGLPTSALGLPGRPARPSSGVQVYINPLDEKDPARNQANLNAAAISTMKHGYILGVQLHKLVGLE